MSPVKAKPAGANGGHRGIEISDWKPLTKNTLRGFFTATLPSGMILHNLMLHEKDGSRWIGFPAREWTDNAGQKKYARFVEFTGRDIADRFRDAALAAIDAHLEGQL